MKPLKVAPAKSVYTPRYPGYLDKNPFYYPATRPYPFSMKMIRFLAQAGIASAAILSPMIGFGQVDSLYNPFPETRTGLPYYATMFGTGEPKRLSAKDVVGAIDRVFADEGLEIVKNKFIEREASKYIANTFNEKYKIGYIWIQGNLGSGMVKTYGEPWWTSKKKDYSDIKKDWGSTQDSEYQRFRKDRDAYLKDKKELQRRLLPAILKLKSETKKAAFFREQYIDYKQQELLYRIKKFDGDRHSIPLQWIFDSPKRLKPIDRLTISGLYWKIAQYSFNDKFKSALEKEVAIIMKYKKRKWLKRSKELHHLLSHTNLGHLKSNQKYQSAFLDILNSNWRHRDFNQLHELDNFFTLDYFEMGQIDKDNEDGTLFIAPISYLDERYAVPNNFLVLPETNISVDSLTVQEELAKMEGASPEEVEKIYAQLYGDETKLTPAERERKQAERWKHQQEAVKMDVLRQLENDVRMYIQWAKAQQGY